jgi:hypothetical protein
VIPELTVDHISTEAALGIDGYMRLGAHAILPSGTVLRAAYALRVNTNDTDEFVLKLRDSGLRLCRTIVKRGWDAHRAVVNPIDNGPADRVALAEASYRIDAACNAYRQDMPGSADELNAANDYYRACVRPFLPLSPTRTNN